MQLWQRSLLILLLASGSDGLQAQTCGTLLAGSVTLSRDMDCRGFPYAFKAVRDGAVVNLNGRTIRGGGYGVLVYGVRGVSVRGPGRLEGTQRGVAGYRADFLTVSGVEIVGALTGVELLSSRSGRIEYVSFTGIGDAALDIRQPTAAAALGAGGHVVHGNAFGYGFHGLRICGADAGGNVVTGNSFVATENYSLQISHEAGGNRIQENVFRDGAWFGMNTTSGNIVIGNVFEDSRGISLVPGWPSDYDCYTRRGDAKASGNQFFKNRFYRSAGLRLGHSSIPDSYVFANRIGDNRFEDVEVGIAFNVNAFDNDATGNIFTRVTRPISDAGFGNTY